MKKLIITVIGVAIVFIGFITILYLLPSRCGYGCGWHGRHERFMMMNGQCGMQNGNCMMGNGMCGMGGGNCQVGMQGCNMDNQCMMDDDDDDACMQGGKCDKDGGACKMNGKDSGCHMKKEIKVVMRGNPMMGGGMCGMPMMGGCCCCCCNMMMGGMMNHCMTGGGDDKCMGGDGKCMMDDSMKCSIKKMMPDGKGKGK